MGHTLEFYLEPLSTDATKFGQTNNKQCLHVWGIVREPNYENSFDLILAASPCEKAITVPDTNFDICNQKINVGHAKSW